MKRIGYVLKAVAIPAIFVLTTVVTALPVSASTIVDTSDKITSFDSNIIITQAGVAKITETITYTNNEPHHGLERFIPTLVKDINTNKSYYFRFKLIGVKDKSGISYPVSRHDDMMAAKLRIGDPNTTFTGAKTYVIEYELSPVVSKQDKFDFLNLNITGNDWRIPIEKANAHLKIEGTPLVHQAICFVGEVGSKETDCAILEQNGEYNLSNLKSIMPGEGMTVNMQIEQDYFDQYLSSSNIPPFWWIARWVIGWIIAIVIVLIAILFRVSIMIKSWLDKKNQTIVVEYKPPSSMSPAEIGLLTDNKSAMPEITATLIDLAIRKYIKIEQTKTQSLFSRAKYKFTLLKSNFNSLQNYESKLLETMFSELTDGAQVDLSAINQNKMSKTIVGIYKMLNENLEQKGYYSESKFSFRQFFKMKGWASRVVIICLIVAILLLFLIYATTISPDGYWQIVLIFGGAVVAIAISIIKRPTKSGLSQWAKIEGFKIFLSMTEKDRLKFTDAPEKNPHLFSKMLPYAIALGVEKDWAKQFDGMDMRKEMYWYNSSDSSFSTGLFASNLSNMTSQFSSSVSSGFSASSSGGGAGGGAGGGGGGGW